MFYYFTPLCILTQKQRPTLDILKSPVTILRNQDKKVTFIRVDEDGELARSSEFMKKCHNINIIVQTIYEYASSLNDKSEIPNKTLDNITRDRLLKSIHNKKMVIFLSVCHMSLPSN